MVAYLRRPASWNACALFEAMDGRGGCQLCEGVDEAVRQA
jgi:hypothetical protein